MCVLTSAVDIFILTHREAVTGYPAGHRLASFLPSYLLCSLPSLPLVSVVYSFSFSWDMKELVVRRG